MPREYKCVPLLERFGRHFVPEPMSGCWLWTGPINGNGYGRLKVLRRIRGATRLSWELHHGPIPPGMCVCHKCDTPLCVNPAHLFLGTHADNMHDMKVKGRGRGLVGEANGFAKLTDAAVREIRTRRAAGETQTEIAKHVGIDQTTVSRVLLGQRWRHVA